MMGGAKLVALLTLGLAGCTGGRDVDGLRRPCVGASGTPRPIANVGPDVTLAVTCGATMERPIASVSAVEGGPVDWWARVDGPPGVFSFDFAKGRACANGPVDVIHVAMTALPSAKVGDVFDGLVAILQEGKATPLGTAMVHGTVTAAPEVAVTPTVLDFGDLPVGQDGFLDLTFATPNADALLYAWTPDVFPGIFSIRANASFELGNGFKRKFTVAARGTEPGEVTQEVVWRILGQRDPTPPVRCAQTVTVTMRARIVP